MRHLKTTLAVLGAVTILVLAGNTISMAATGKAFILGKANSANKQTSLTRTTNGPALKVKTKSANNAPLAVNGKGKVANLNADKVDGKDASAFAPATSPIPIAHGFVNTGAGGTVPTLATGSKGVSAVIWNPGDARYELTVGPNYFYNKHVAVVTGTCASLTPITSSDGGKLVVKFAAGTPCTPGGFSYIVYKIA